MAEYLAPGVYVEEVSFRSKSIEGVPTSTTGFAGMTRYGPVQYRLGPTQPGPSRTEPRLITSFTEFERVYGGLGTLAAGPAGAPPPERLTYLAHAARAFFMPSTRCWILPSCLPSGEILCHGRNAFGRPSRAGSSSG